MGAGLRRRRLSPGCILQLGVGRVGGLGADSSPAAPPHPGPNSSCCALCRDPVTSFLAPTFFLRNRAARRLFLKYFSPHPCPGQPSRMPLPSQRPRSTSLTPALASLAPTCVLAAPHSHLRVRAHTSLLPAHPIATATAKSLQSCPTLCNPIDGSPPGSPVPGILQARTLEWVAISFSSA